MNINGWRLVPTLVWCGRGHLVAVLWIRDSPEAAYTGVFRRMAEVLTPSE